MTHSQISCFRASVEHKSFSKAAESMFISQPAVSKQVSQLEAELGLELFTRTQGGLVLTEAGTILYKYFSNAIMEYSAVLEEARRVQQGKDSTIRIGCLGGWDLSCFMPQMRAYIRERHPGYNVVVDGFNFTEMAEELRTGRIDVILTLYTNLLDHPDIPSNLLTYTGGMLVYSASHPLMGRQGLTPAHFSKETFFTIAEPDGYRNTSKHVRECCARYGFDPKIINLNGLSPAFIKVQNGEGVMFVDDWMLPRNSNVFGRLFTDDRFEIGIGCLYDGRNPAKYVFMKEIMEMYRERVSGADRISAP